MVTGRLLHRMQGICKGVCTCALAVDRWLLTADRVVEGGGRCRVVPCDWTLEKILLYHGLE